MNPLRRSYEARVLLVPLGPSALSAARELGQRGVAGVQMLTGTDQGDAVVEPLGHAEQAWSPPPSAGIAAVASSADMVVLLGTDLSSVSESLVREVCQASRDSGDLIAAVLIDPQNWEGSDGANAMVTLRQEVDMLISVKGPGLVAALLDVLRGGHRDPVSDAFAEVPA